MKNVLDLFFNKNIQEINDEISLKKSNILLTNSSENHNILLASTIFEKNEDFIYFVTSNNYKASKYYDIFTHVLGYEKVNLYLFGEVVATEVDATSKEFTYERLQTISNIIKGNKKIIVTTISSVLKE
jgi:transcription-repair coupling factor (superfamily II helicase)